MGAREINGFHTKTHTHIRKLTLKPISRLPNHPTPIHPQQEQQQLPSNDDDDDDGSDQTAAAEYEWGSRFRLQWDRVPLLADFFPAALAERAFFLGAYTYIDVSVSNRVCHKPRPQTPQRQSYPPS